MTTDGKYADDQFNPEESVPAEMPEPTNTPAAPERDPYEAASQATVDYSHFTPQLKPKKRWPRVLGWALLIVIILAGLGAGGYWYANRKPASKPAHQTQQKSQQTQNVVADTTQHYDSSTFNVGFDYPQKWVVSDTDSRLTVTSPAMQLTNADGQAQNGQVIMTIKNANAADFGFFKQGSAVAVLDSQKITYAKPTSTQRADTYISFLQYAATTTHGALDGVYVTGDFGYKYGQDIPETDLTKVNPDIRVAFVKCANAACTGTPTPISISSQMWSNASFSTPITNMFKSLTIQ